MSAPLLNLGVSGLMAQSKQLAAIGNNIANSDTAGYKREDVSFAEAFYSASGRQASGMVNQGGSGTSVNGLQSNWNTGAHEETGIATNMAINGDGFFPVKLNGQGSILYSRAGDFSWIDAAQTNAGVSGFVLGRPNGALLLDKDLDVLQFTEIPTSFEVTSDGTISYEMPNGSGTATLGLQRFGSMDALKKGEGGLYEASDAAAPLSPTSGNPTFTPGTDSGTIRQGAVESSNVDMVRELTDLIAAQRAFQANSRTVTTADTILQETLSLKR